MKLKLKLKFNNSNLITLLYLSYILNFSVLATEHYGLDFSLFRNAMIILLFFISLIKTNFKIILPIFIFITVCILSVFFNSIHPVFNAKMRLVFFIITISGLGLLFKNRKDSEEFINLNLLFRVNTFIIILSFLSYFTFIGTLGRGNFGGLLSHSNTLGPIAALVCVGKVLEYYKGDKKRKHLIIALIALFVLILSGSRSAIASLFISLFFIGLYLFRIKFIVWGTALLLVLISAFFVLKEYNHLLIPEERLNKRYRPATIFEKGLDNTRLLIWGERIDEFIENPLLGSGFSAVNTNVVPEESASYDIETGSIQPGSGYLGVLSMTGFLGFSSFLLILCTSLMTLYNKRKLFKQTDFLLIVSALIFILLHSIFEGYILSSGNILFIIFWIL